MGLEGIIAKRADAVYESRRTRTWIKLKCGLRQEFLIVGYTKPQGARTGFGALLLAVHGRGGKLRYAGKVGTGFDWHLLHSLSERLEKLRVSLSPLAGTAGLPRDVMWVKPVLLAEISFGEWTKSGHVRHATFRGLRCDKAAQSIEREKAVPVAETQSDDKPASAPRRRSRSIKLTHSQSRMPSRLTHPDRVIDPSSGLTKLDLARYDGLVASLLLPHLKGRPVSFVRAPEGIEGEHFFQKHLEGMQMAGVESLPGDLDPQHPPLMEVVTQNGILSAAQMNVVEFHTWNARKTSIGKPDRMVFDIDPGEGVQWAAIQQAAELVHVLLRELELDSWLKTSGGKGLHVIVPLRRQYGWELVKGFSRAIVQHLAATVPKTFVSKSGPSNRVGKIFVDYLRNGFGSTTVSAWSARARPGMGVSVPVDWNELARLKSSAQWTIKNIRTRLDAGNTPWKAYKPQSLSRAMKILEYAGPDHEDA